MFLQTSDDPIWNEDPEQNGPLVQTDCILLAFNVNTDLTYSQNWGGQTEQTETDSDRTMTIKAIDRTILEVMTSDCLYVPVICCETTCDKGHYQVLYLKTIYVTEMEVNLNNLIDDDFQNKTV